MKSDFGGLFIPVTDNVSADNYGDALKTLYERQLLIRAIPRLIHGRWGQKSVMNGYNIKEWRRYEAMSAVTSAISTEGTTPSEETQPTLTTVTATPAWYGAYLIYTDEFETTSYDPVVAWMVDVLGEQAGLSIDTIRRNAITGSNVTQDFAGGQTARTDLDSPDHDISYLDVLIAIAQLEASNARPLKNGNFVVILHPHSYFTLMNDETFVNAFVNEASNSGNDPLRSGYIGTFMGCDFYRTSNAREYANGGVGSTDVYSMLFIGRDAYGCVGLGDVAPSEVDMAPDSEYTMTGRGGRAASPVEVIVKGLGESGSADPLNQRGSVGWKAAEDTQVLNSVFALDMEHTNIFSDS